jgi:arsenate reductase (thioredoxin)
MGNKRVLFVCTYQGARAKIAEEYARKYADGKIDVFSSCFENGKIGKLVINVIDEVGIKFSSDSPKSVFDRHAAKEQFDYVITLCNETGSEQCALFKLNIDTLYKDAERISWSVQDFKSIQGIDEEKVIAARAIRDNIKKEVISFLMQIGINLDVI